MATIIIDPDGKAHKATISEKAAWLFHNGYVSHYEPGVIAVRSQRNPSKAYAVCHDEQGNITDCACTHCRSVSSPSDCSYKEAASMKLRSDRRELHCHIFGLYEIYG